MANLNSTVAFWYTLFSAVLCYYNLEVHSTKVEGKKSIWRNLNLNLCKKNEFFYYTVLFHMHKCYHKWKLLIFYIFYARTKQVKIIMHMLYILFFLFQIICFVQRLFFLIYHLVISYHLCRLSFYFFISCLIITTI